jgi:hypothetical protein
MRWLFQIENVRGVTHICLKRLSVQEIAEAAKRTVQ